MKRISKLQSGQIKVLGKPVEVNRAFDTLLLDLLSSDRSQFKMSDSAIRILTKEEIKLIPSVKFRVGRENLRRRLEILGLLLLAGSMAANAVTFGQKSEWVTNHAPQLVDYINKVKDITNSFLQ